MLHAPALRRKSASPAVGLQWSLRFLVRGWQRRRGEPLSSRKAPRLRAAAHISLCVHRCQELLWTLYKFTCERLW